MNLREDHIMHESASVTTSTTNTQSNMGRGIARDYPENVTAAPPPGQPQAPDKIYEINISPLDRGFIVRVGCQTMAIPDKLTLIAKLTAYINNPQETQRRYMEGTF